MHLYILIYNYACRNAGKAMSMRASENMGDEEEKEEKVRYIYIYI
jgi:hypothetical protein